MMPGSRKLSKVGAGGGGGGGGVHLQTRVGPDSRDFFFKGGGEGGIEGVRTPSPKPWFVHGNYTEDFQNERKMRSQVNMPRQSRTFWLP